MNSIKRYILTGTPGSGKTSVLTSLEKSGYSVISEAATDIISYEQTQKVSEPWLYPVFIDNIVNLQKQRQEQEQYSIINLQFYDRSPICTYALAIYLGFEPSIILLKEIESIIDNEIYQKKVFFIENIGFCTPSNVRKITYEQSIIFERIHREAYEKFGFECINIAAKPIKERTCDIINAVNNINSL